MEATAITLREAFDKSVAGDYSIDEAGNLWKGSQFNVSAATELVDSVKHNTGYEVTQIVSAMTDNMVTLNEVAAILKDESKAFEI